jgi:chromatin structure-remodeling complex subunit RSC1/2
MQAMSMSTVPIPDMAVDGVRRASMMSASAMDASRISVPYVGPGAVPSPSPSQYNAHMTSHFQPVTPVAVPPQIHQTPVPIPHPPHLGTPGAQVPGVRPMQYQQHTHQLPQAGYAQNYAQGYAQSPAPPMHQQPQMASPMGPAYGQVPVAAVARPPLPTPGNTMPPGNMYNPPRPPEVYTLPDNLNDVFPDEVRQSFQHDSAGRILFFTAPPLDRLHKGVSNESAGLGHSIKYLAGKQQWLANRETKRKQRDENDALESKKRIELKAAAAREAKEEIVAQASDAMSKWLEDLDKDTQKWKKDAGLEGWGKPQRQNGVA